MKKKLISIFIACALIAFAGIGFGIWHSVSSHPEFIKDGFVLTGEGDTSKKHSFSAGSAYSKGISGTVHFETDENKKVSVPSESFIHYGNESVVALSDGVLLDLNDLSNNFINNYYITSGLEISQVGGTYRAQATSGEMTFGDNVWKLSDINYIIQSPKLRVFFSKGDTRDVENFVQVLIADNGIAKLMTADNLWMTISDGCYIETASGVKIYPITKIVDDGNFKMSLSKLSVSPDDAIVLTPDEIRQQTIPEFDIKGVDGEDGTDGEGGVSGADGNVGTTGTEGAVGDAGEIGKTGEIAEDGAAGAAGAHGSGGDNGALGSDGTDGNPGASGRTGKTGSSAVTESTVNSALPTMAITDWNVSPTAISGTINISDTAGYFQTIGELGDYAKYPARVSITNVKTGEVIYCKQASENTDYQVTMDSSEDFGSLIYSEGAEEIYFSTLKGEYSPLEPDTQYKLSVTAYYKATDETGLIYSREFISRFFYTDSLGVVLSHAVSEINALSVEASLLDGYEVSSAMVYLLTPEQNKNFTTASMSDGNNYVDSKSVSFTGKGPDAQQMSFTGLDSNKIYVARVYVETDAGLKLLSTQELEMKTLKRTPVPEDETKVNYNRVNGSFEVWRPNVKDPDGGASSYIYTAWKYDSDKNDWIEVGTRTVAPNSDRVVEFHLDSGEQYKFNVEMIFDDNQKLVHLNLGDSKSIVATGDTMPRIELIPTSQEYNKYEGIIRINLGSKSSLAEPAPGKPIRVEIYADQVMDSSVNIEQKDTPVDVSGNGKLGTISYSSKVVTEETNYVDISLNLKNLYKNTNYSVTVFGYLDLASSEDDGQTLRAVGTVSFRTYETLALSAKWKSSSDQKTTISKILSLEAVGGTDQQTRKDYALGRSDGTSEKGTLYDGQVTVELFSGTGAAKVRVAQKNFNLSKELNQIYSEEGYEITEADFGGMSLSTDKSYTLTVSMVTDRSYELDLGYVNEFDRVENPSTVVSAEAQPPDLLIDPKKGITVRPILNGDANKWETDLHDSNLPDDAIIGYTLESTYSNVQRIGKTITYYAFELTSYFSAFENNTDPVESQPLFKVTRDIDKNSNTVDKVAFLFGGTASTDSSVLRNGYYVYHTGVANKQGEQLISGMERGFRYIFAYTVDYTAANGETEVIKTYPYGHRDYDLYNASYGGLTMNGINKGKGIAYVLTSPVQEAPYIMPDFHSFILKSTLDENHSTSGSGNVTLDYTFRDPDKLILQDGTTQISYRFNNADISRSIVEKSIGGKWYEMDFNYAISKCMPMRIEPKANIQAYYGYNPETDVGKYDRVLTIFDLTRDSSFYPVAEIPVDWNWEDQFNQPAYQGILVTLDASEKKLQQNCIEFQLNYGNDEATQELVDRAVAMRLVISIDGSSEKRTYVLPLTYEVGNVFARLATGLLGSQYLGRDFTVETAEILYDTGKQGWSILDTDDNTGYTLQYVTYDEDNGYIFSDYWWTKDATRIAGNGSYFAGSGKKAADLLSCITSSKETDTKLALRSQRLLTSSSGYETIYVYPSSLGTDAMSQASVLSLSGKLLVPKKVSAYELTFANGQNRGTLSRMTPTIQLTSWSMSEVLAQPNGITVEGLNSGGTIYMAAYLNKDDAVAMNTQYAVAPVPIQIGADGTPVSGAAIAGLTEGTTYYISMYYYPDGEGNPPVALIRSDRVEQAIWTEVTSRAANITFSNCDYVNTSYHNKKLEVGFFTNRTFNLTYEYDIYASEEDIFEGKSPLIKYAEMKTDDPDTNILTAPNSVSTSGLNEVIVNLKPSVNRSKLQPGNTYYFKISAFEKDADRTPAGSAYEAFTINEVGQFGSIMYVNDALVDSIHYQITVSDPEYSLMGTYSGPTDYDGGLYAVRFTDINGNRIFTTYDDYVYSISELKKEFILNDDNVLNDSRGLTINKTVEPETEYIMNLYAVPDRDHDGNVTIGSSNNGVTYNWSQIFDPVQAKTDLSSCGTVFLEILNTFWNADTSKNASAEISAVETQLLIASKIQSTTAEGGYIVNEEAAYASRVTISGRQELRIYLEDSFGLVDEEEPVFKKIIWEVQGRSGSLPVNVMDEALYSHSQPLIKKGTDSGGYIIYYYDIPYHLESGSYYVNLHLYLNEDDSAPTNRITVRAN